MRDLRELKSILEKPNSPSSSIYSALHALGEDHKPDGIEQLVASYLDHQDADVRAASLDCLVRHWGLKQYEHKCMEMFEHDSNIETAGIAASCLGEIYRCTLDKKILKMFATKISDDSLEYYTRSMCYSAALLVLCVPSSEHPSALRDLDFPNEPYWNEIMSFAKE